jgi:hypothetical protein
MLRRLAVTVLLAGVFVAPAAAQDKVVLTPGVTYERQVEFTRHGPVVMHVLEAPRPGGLYSLRPVLSNGAVSGRETVSSMQRRAGATATVAGVNGDLFRWADGRPSGMFMQGGVLATPPNPGRSSLGIDATGLLQVDRVTWNGTWQGNGQRRAITTLNDAPGPNGISLFTPAWGPNTPAVPGATIVVLQPFPALTPNTDLSGVVAAVTQTTSAIPRDGAVLMARGTAGQKLAAEAPSGLPVAIRFALRPDWATVADAIGGGPALVRNGGPVFRPYEEFTTEQMLPRQPRTGVGQRADGSLVLVAVDGRRPGYSAGLTNFELARAMARLGCVTATALDAGGSTTMAFEGEILNRPSDPVERPVAEGLFVFYEGVHAPPAEEPVIAVSSAAAAARQDVSYKVVRPSTVTATLIAPDRSVKFSETLVRAPGTYRYAFDEQTLGNEPLQGRWHWVVNATDDLARQSSIDRGFWVNGTLTTVDVAPSLLRAGAKNAGLDVSVGVASRAKVVVAIESASGALVRTLVKGTLNAGAFTYRWDGRDFTRELVHSGTYVARVTTENAYGPMELERSFAVKRVVVKPKPKPKPKKKRAQTTRG